MPSEAATLTVQSRGVRLAARRWAGSDPGLVLIHGLASTSHVFDLVAPLLAREFRVVAYDQRGHGESGKPGSGYGFASLTDDALAVITATGLRRPVLLGHSWGANVALECAVRWPRTVAGLILLDGGIVPIRRWLLWPAAREALAPPLFDGIPLESYLERARRHLTDVPWTETVERFVISLVRVDPDGAVRPRLSLRNHMRIVHSMWHQDPVELLRRVELPTLVLAVRERSSSGTGPLVGAKEDAVGSAQKIGRPVRIEWIDGIHDVPLQHPQAVADRVRAFVRSLPA